MNDQEKVLYADAAKKGWQVLVGNQAIELVSADEAKKMRSRLRHQGEEHRILTPRFVYTGKNDRLRTEKHPLPMVLQLALWCLDFAMFLLTMSLRMSYGFLHFGAPRADGHSQQQVNTDECRHRIGIPEGE